MSSIHPTAIVDPKARIDADASIGPYTIIGPDVEIGAGSQIHNHVTIGGATTIGKQVQIHPGAVLGGPPQDLKYKGERTTLSIGDHTIIRECCTLHVGTELGGCRTVVGARNLIMAYVHIAHDCILADNIVIANAAQLAGHVHVHDGARISGLAALHHFVTIGTCAYVAGCAKLSIDVPPFTLAEGHPAKVKALNKEGMKRRGFSLEVMSAIRDAFKWCFRDSNLTRADALLKIEAAGYEKHPEVKLFTDFLRATAAGKFGRALEAEREVVPPDERDGTMNFKIKEKD
jgi:UDP-N-acetylglucosamine acyltransferase